MAVYSMDIPSWHFTNWFYQKWKQKKTESISIKTLSYQRSIIKASCSCTIQGESIEERFGILVMWTVLKSLALFLDMLRWSKENILFETIGIT